MKTDAVRSEKHPQTDAIPSASESHRPLNIRGLVAATFTPMDKRGDLDLARVGGTVDELIRSGVNGLYVNGSTGEGVSLTGAERRQTAEAFVEAVAGRIPVIVQVGHNSLREAQELATHAQKIGASAISATPPMYFKPASIDLLIQSLREVMEGAPELPFYYYHLPRVTGIDFDLHPLLAKAAEVLPQMAGVKYTAPTIHEFQACTSHFAGRFELLYGTDEMLLSGLSAGAEGAVGSTYNFAPGLYQRIIDAYRRGDNDAARQWQLRSVEMVQVFLRYPALPAQKAIMEIIGQPVGPPRLPWRPLSLEDTQDLEHRLKQIGFLDWHK